ncbi:MAG TPA: hypothetical protein VD790_11345 [Thermoleophilaceae bacterium]|nr:hypothetical protein [Thermoleophilaceae bacterium]
MIDQALAAAPYSGEQLDALDLEEMEATANALLAVRVPPEHVLDALAALPDRDREVVMGFRFAAAMVVPARLSQLDAAIDSWATCDRLRELADRLAVEGAERPIGAIIQRLEEWLWEADPFRQQALETPRDQWRPAWEIPRAGLAEWLSGASVATSPGAATITRPRARAPRTQRRSMTRSSGRGGDSGDPDLGDEDPEPARPPRSGRAG